MQSERDQVVGLGAGQVPRRPARRQHQSVSCHVTKQSLLETPGGEAANVKNCCEY